MKTLHQPVAVTAMSFGRNMAAYPTRMEWQGRTYDFVDRGVRTTVRRGDKLTSIITLTDGHQEFCLRQQGREWTLLGVQ